MTKTHLKLFWPIILLLLYFSSFYLVYINLFNSDIGRHIANGRVIWDNLKSGSLHSPASVLTTNFYSFTQTDFPTINHHWFFGIFAYFLHIVGGFELLTWFNWLLNTAAFALILATAIATLQQKSKVGIVFVAIIGFFLMPLLTHRDEVRPESISLLFFSLYYFLFSSGLILKKKWLFAIILGIQIIWVNSHLFFILGPLLAGYFLFERVLTLLFGNSKNRVRLLFTDKKIRLWFALTFGLFAVSIVNPNGLAGALAPLQIFNNYAYRVAENQSTFFMIKYGANVLLYSYFIAISFIALLLTLCTLRNKEVPLGKRIAQLLLLTPFIFLANKINRMSPFFAVLVIPFIVQVCHKFINHLYEKHKQKFQDSIFIMGGSTVTCIVLILVLKLGFFVPHISMIGAGVLSDTYIPAHFFLENNLHGPVFNNYDIGGYLAYNLFPKEKLFLDNRPEAYAGEFLTDEYLAALKDEAVWKSLVQKYQLNVIFFLRHDQIDGAQQFLYNRVTDPEWVPVFVDDFVLILVKNSEQNKSVIDRYKLPQELFVMR